MGQTATPLAQQFLTDTPGVGGRIKVRPEDFLVDEQPLYQPCGSGEHLYLFVEKRNVSHMELMAVLRKCFNVRDMNIGFAGMKDKVGVTRQIVSIHLPKGAPALRAGSETHIQKGAPALRAGSTAGSAEHSSESRATLDLNHDRIAVLWADRHTNKIKRGHLAGNRFSIRIRDVDPLKAPLVLKTLRTLEKTGVPNFFGSQRFGYRHNNHTLGALLLAEYYDALLRELVGTGGTTYPQYQQERREMFDAGKYDDALKQWTPADGSEKSVLRALARGKNPKQACFAVGKTTSNFWIASMQSAVFNRILDKRLEDGTLDQLTEGDLAWNHGARKVFDISADLVRDAEIVERLARLDISPSGPLWGSRLTRPAPGSAVAAVELDALAAMGFAPEKLLASPHCPDGSRRPLREPLRNADVESGFDEHGPFIRVAFDLPRGVYATIALREIMKNEAGDGE